jgi:hypothetical protein
MAMRSLHGPFFPARIQYGSKADIHRHSDSDWRQTDNNFTRFLISPYFALFLTG